MNSPVRRYLGRGLGVSWVQALLSAWSWGVSLSQCACVHPPGSSLNPVPLGFYGSFLTWSVITPFPAPLSSLEYGGGAESSKLLIMAWSFGWSTPIQEPPRVTLIKQKMFLCSYHPGNDKGFRSSVSGTAWGCQRPIYIFLVSHTSEWPKYSCFFMGILWPREVKQSSPCL